jgi:hypothetical protein
MMKEHKEVYFVGKATEEKKFASLAKAMPYMKSHLKDLD